MVLSGIQRCCLAVESLRMEEARGGLGGRLVKLLESDVLRGEDGGEDVPSGGGDGVTVSGVDFSDEAVGSEHAKLTGNAGGTTMRFLRGVRGGIVEM